jgi:hypothetical protein
MRLRLTIGVAILLLATTVAHAQQGEDLREAAQNPIADLIGVPFQNNTNFDIAAPTTLRTSSTSNLSIRPTSIRTGT